MFAARASRQAQASGPFGAAASPFPSAVSLRSMAPRGRAGTPRAASRRADSRSPSEEPPDQPPYVEQGIKVLGWQPGDRAGHLDG